MPTDDEVYAEDVARLARQRAQYEADMARYGWRDARRGPERGDGRRALVFILLALAAFWACVVMLWMWA